MSCWSLCFIKENAGQRRCLAFCSLVLKWDEGFSFSAVGQKCQARLTALSKQTNKHTQTKILLSHNESITIWRPLPVQFRPSPLNPNKQVHTKDPFVFWQVAFRWQSWVFFWHSSISNKKLERKEKFFNGSGYTSEIYIRFLNSHEVKKHLVIYHCDKLIVNLD